MMREDWTDRLSEYVDGSLAAEERRKVEAFLETSPEARKTLDDLREVVRLAGALVDRAPKTNLWVGIEEGIGRKDPQVIDLAARRAAESAPARPARRRIQFTIPQLAAASVALMLMSSGAAWMARSPAVVAAAPDVTPLETAVRLVSDVPPALRGYAVELAELETTLMELKPLLDPKTVEVLERNLRIIDRAIAESRQALETDPANEYLSHHHEGAWRRKVEYLRETISVAQWSL